jgi:excisionase family DNA binding protein
MDKQILSSTEAAAYLDISLHQLYKLSSSGKLPTYSPTGGKIYFLQSDIEEWVLGSRRATVKNFQSQATKLITLKTK